MSASFQPGQKVKWLRTTARGYGFQETIHATVVRVGEKTVRIEAPLVKGGTKQTNVRPHNLRPFEPTRCINWPCQLPSGHTGPCSSENHPLTSQLSAHEQEDSP